MKRICWVLDFVQHDQPNFGYGTLTENLESYLNSDHTPNWNEIEDCVFSGIMSTHLVSEHGERGYQSSICLPYYK